MKQIIDGLLYDSEKAECIGEYYYADGWRSFYKTAKMRYFIEVSYDIFILSESEVMRVLGEADPDKYIELFGPVEEA